MTETIQTQLDHLRALRLPDLQARFAELVGEETRCPNKAFLLRRIGEALEARVARATPTEDASVEVTTPTDDAPAREEVDDDTPPTDTPVPTRPPAQPTTPPQPTALAAIRRAAAQAVRSRNLVMTPPLSSAPRARSRSARSAPRSPSGSGDRAARRSPLR